MNPAAGPSATLLARHLPALLERLRAARYTVGPGEQVDLERLLARAACQGHWPLPPQALARVVAPVVCRSAAEQQAFGDHFRAWLAELPTRAQPTRAQPTRAQLTRSRRASSDSTAQRDPRRKPPAKPTSSTPKPGPRFAARLLRMAAILLVLVLLAFLVRWWVRTQYLPAEITPITTPIVERPAPVGTAARVLRVGGDSPFWPIVFAVSLWFLPIYYAWLYGGLLPARLRRHEAFRIPVLDRLKLGRPARALGESWRGIRRLCDRDPRPDRDLRIPATVRATLNRGGYFTPVYGHRPEMPQYLGLIDRRSPEDHLARFASELMTRLEERGLAVRTLFFSRDPRAGVGRPGQGFSSLATLASQARAERLLIFSSAESFLDPRRGRLWTGLGALSRWRQRFLLTPRPETPRTRLEQTLAADGLMSFPLSDPGLAAVAEQLASQDPTAAGSAPPVSTSGSRLRHLLSDEAAKRWLDDASPGAAEIRALLDALADDLGEAGHRWLRACAVFPAISWPVTLHLGQQLTEDSGQPLFTEERLLQLAQLPWFRHGMMPDWLRLELIDGMEAEERDQIRQSLLDLLGEATRATRPDHEPELAQATGWGGGRTLRRFLARQGPDSPLRDHLFITFLRGRRPSRLALTAPRRLRTLIRDADRWSVLTSAFLALVGTLMIAAWYQFENLPLGPALPPITDLQVVPKPTPTQLPEATLAVVILTLSTLVVGISGRRRRSPSPPAAEAAVPSLITRISERRWPVLAPWLATCWVLAFVAADMAGSPRDLRWMAAHLVTLLLLIVYAYLELGISNDFRRQLGRLEAQLEAGNGAKIAGEIVAFLRTPAATSMKRRLLHQVHAKVREPTSELVRQLFELQQSGLLEPRTRSLLEWISRHLEQRLRQRLQDPETK